MFHLLCGLGIVIYIIEGSTKVVVGKIVKVKNSAKKGNSSSHYNCITVVDPNGNPVQLLVTDSELSRFSERAEKYSSTIPDASWKDRLMLLFM